MPLVCGPCGAVQKKRSVVSTRSRAASRDTHPCSMPIGYAVSANPTAATLENDFVGQRSGVSPLRGLVVCQKKSKVRRESVSRNALSPAVAEYDEAARGCVAVSVGVRAHAMNA